MFDFLFLKDSIISSVPLLFGKIKIFLEFFEFDFIFFNFLIFNEIIKAHIFGEFILTKKLIKIKDI